jgi:hypothetical protein
MVACSVVLVAPPVAHAAKGGDAVEKVTALNKKALAAYGKQDYDEAAAALREALDLCNSAGLDKHPIKARTHIHLGIVNIVGLNKRAVGIKHFKKALEIQPDIKLTKSLSTADLEEAFAEAQGAGGGDEGGGGGGSAAQASDEGGGGGGATAAREGGEEGGGAASGEDEDEHPRAKPRPRKRKPSDEDENDSGEPGTGQTGRFFVALTLGGGFGIATGHGELDPTAHKLSGPGFAPAQLGQVAPEVGFFVMPRLLLSAQARIQYVSALQGEKTMGTGCGTDMYCQASTLGFAAFAKGTWLFGDSGFRPFVGGLVGGGNIRHVVKFTPTNCGTAMNVQCVDSVKSGPFFLGPTAGFLYELGSAANLVAALNTEVGVPNFTVNFDLDVGVAFRL